MTATNHAVTGALIATIIPNPLIVLPLSFIAHFVMDAIPHFGIKEQNAIKRNKNRTFLLVLMIDVMIAGLLLLSLPLAFDGTISPWLIFASMLACMAPDLVWGWRFYGEIKYKLQKRMSSFSIFHEKIQWSETTKGLIVEIIWFVAVFNLVFLPL